MVFVEVLVSTWTPTVHKTRPETSTKRHQKKMVLHMFGIQVGRAANKVHEGRFGARVPDFWKLLHAQARSLGMTVALYSRLG